MVEPTSTCPPPETSSTPAAQADALYCPHCGYDLRLLTGAACPECGGAVDADTLQRLTLPWTRRADLGRLRALWRTFWTVTWRTRVACGALARPIDFKDALRFRRTVVWLVWLALLLAAAVTAVMTAARGGADMMRVLHGAEGAWYLTISLFMAVAAWPALYLVTGVHTYWFHPRRLSMEQQNRAVALSYYACAPLLAFVPAGAMLVVAVCLTQSSPQPAWSISLAAAVGLLIAGALLAVVALAAFWSVCLAMARRGAHRETLGLAVMAVALPACWAVLTVLCLLGPLLVAGLVYAIVQTM